MGVAHQQPQACDDRLQMHKGAKPGWRVAGQEGGSNQELPTSMPKGNDMMWQQATRGFKQVLNQRAKSRNVAGVIKICACTQLLVFN